ncbi:MAG: hypothetical protein GY839_00330 [candidate division Zixibacteria bacterium]|nr:hypothetical protein [candidate division Zixibacteria bacterium]
MMKSVSIRIMLAVLAVIFIFANQPYAQNIDLSGQASAAATLGTDPSEGRSHLDEIASYIPTLAIGLPIGPSRLIDFEAAYKGDALLDGFFGSGPGGADTHGELFRLWGRYSSERLELRAGLQKISFGPGLILRPLNWFDTLDPKDPTGQTDGVTAIRARYFFGNTLNLTGWAIRPDNFDLIAPGGRIEKTFSMGDAAISYHHRPAYETADIRGNAGIPLLPSATYEDRFAADLRVDIGIGLWTEAVHSRASNMNRSLIMAGGDFTFDIGNGLYILGEHLIDIRRKLTPGDDESDHITAAMMNYPIGISESLVMIVEYDWQRKLLFNYLRVQRDYDRLSLNLMIFANPGRDEFGFETPSALAGFGTGIQFMVIYNH